MNENLDELLYKEYINGNKEAFETLYNKYKNGICYFIYNIVKNYEQAEDITQEVFIYILKNGLNSEYTFKNYIYLIARSKAFNYFNKIKRREKIDEKYLLNTNENIDQDISDIIAKSEMKKNLLMAIEQLDEKYKNAVYLISIEEMSYKEASEILGISLSNIKILVHRGKKDLKKILIKKGFENMNKFAKILLIVIGIGVLSTGIAYGATRIYEQILKSYYQEETVNEPVSDSQAPTGEIVYKNFTIKENEKAINSNEWNENEYTYYKQINTYAEYKNLMDNYSDLRKLTENDFKNYFAFIILNKDNTYELKYKFITYSEDNNGDDPILSINVLKDNLTNTNDSLNQGLVVIMTQKHRDYKIIPQIIN